MKRKITLMILAFLCIFQINAQVKIGDNPTVLDSSAILELKSSSKGLLIPRMTQAERNSILSPATGLMIFQTDSISGFYYYNGNAWTSIGGGIANESDPVFTASAANGINLIDINNWNNAYYWGNHIGLYRPNYWVPDWNEIVNKPNLFNGSWYSLTDTPILTSVAITGDYNDLINTPSIFSGSYYDLTDKPIQWDSSWTSIKNKPIFFNGTWASLTGKPAFSTVSVTGKYNDLLFKPTLFSGIYSDLIGKPTQWDSSWASIKNKPIFFDGEYNSLLNKPSLFDGNWSSLTNKPNFAIIATSGNYADLTDKPELWDSTWTSIKNKPSFFDGVFNSLTGKPTTLEGYGISNAISTTHVSNGITTTNISNWNTAFSWGMHDGLYRPIGWVPAWTDVTGKPAFATIASTGNYNDLNNKPVLFSGNYSDLTNKPTQWDSTWASIKNKPIFFNGDYNGLVNKPNLFDGNWSSLSGKPAFATIASTGNYNDINNKPVLFSGNYSDLTNKPTQWDSTWASIKNKPIFFNGDYNGLVNRPNLFDGNWSSLSGKPAFATIASTGNYNDLNNKPVLFSGNYSDLTNKPTQWDSTWASIKNKPIFFNGDYNGLVNRPNLFDGNWSSLSGKPTFATIASTGNYNDLNNKPVLFSGNYSDLTNKPTQWDSTWASIKNKPIFFNGDYNGLVNRPNLFDGNWSSLSGKPTFATIASTGNYNDINNKPVLFSGNYSDLTNKPTQWDSTWASIKNKPIFFNGDYNGLVNKPNLFDGNWSSLSGKPAFATIASTGNYNDINNKPVLFSGNYSDLTNKPTQWDSTWASIKNKPIFFNGDYNGLVNKPNLFDGNWSNLSGKPAFATIAYTGNYNDLNNKPVLFSGNYSDLTNKPTQWDSTWASIKNKPIFFDGEYNSLINKPSLFDGVFDSLTGKPTTLEGYGISNAISTSHASYGITTTNISNWNTAFSWGMHEGLYRPIGWVPAWTDVTGKPTFATIASTGNYNDLNNKPVLFSGNYSDLSNKPTQWDSSWVSIKGKPSIDTSATNEIQTLSISNDTIFLSNGGFVKIRPSTVLFPPSVSIQPTTNLQFTSVTLNGIVNGKGLFTTVFFEWGLSTSYGNTVSISQTAVTGDTDINVSANITGLQSATTYHYRIKATNAVNLVYSNDFSFTTLTSVPQLTTNNITTITATSATSGGNITTDGGASVAFRGVCWSTSPNPFVTDSHTSDGTGSGVFTSNISGLAAGTTYFLRAYATNSIGTAFGNEVSFTSAISAVTDIDGNIYNTVAIGTQVWMKENLKVTKYRNGDLIGTTTPATLDISGESSPKYQWAYNGDENNVATYGRLYTWYVVADSRNLCPKGWHVPSDAEWTILTTYLGGESIAGSKLKEAGLSHWNSPNTAATNETGFTALPGGSRYYTGTFNSIGNLFSCWSSTELNSAEAWFQTMYYNNSDANWDAYDQRYGRSVRCLKSIDDITDIATVSTTAITNITETTASSGGNVSFDGGATVTTRGVCWSISSNPTVTNFHTSDGIGSGIFTSNINGLGGSTTYFLRAYATNSIGTAYGNEVSFTTALSLTTVTDIDGNVYNTVAIGTQVWMKENLKVTKYRNSNLIGTTTLDISSESSPKYQWAYNGNENNVATYGRLYTWYVVNDSRNLCPSGWHVPSDAEWTTLTTYLGGVSIAGGKLAGLSHWNSPNTAATNETGFTALPGGGRDYNGTFYSIGSMVNCWSSTESSTGSAWVLYVYNCSSQANIDWFDKRTGLSVRCLKD
ncbi:MAG: FISUMP domain-containing protein [Bacteroidales bacterium]